MDIYKALDDTAEMLYCLEKEKRGTLVSICYRVAGQDSVVVGYVDVVKGPVVKLNFQNSSTELSKSNIVYYNAVKLRGVPVCVK
jgi:hypothetical protein